MRIHSKRAIFTRTRNTCQRFPVSETRFTNGRMRLMTSLSYEQHHAASNGASVSRRSAKSAGAPFQAPLRVCSPLSKDQAQGLIHIVADLLPPTAYPGPDSRVTTTL